jgi:hypothetical protein
MDQSFQCRLVVLGIALDHIYPSVPVRSSDMKERTKGHILEDLRVHFLVRQSLTPDTRHELYPLFISSGLTQLKLADLSRSYGLLPLALAFGSAVCPAQLDDSRSKLIIFISLTRLVEQSQKFCTGQM